MTSSETFVHRFLPGSGPEGPVLLLLHGTGGDENDLIPLGQALLPGAALLSLRGKVLENGMPRFFRRLAEGVFDLHDLRRRTNELAAFLLNFRTEKGLTTNRLVAVGYSNGANIAVSLLLSHPFSLSGAVLFRAMVPFRPQSTPNLHAIPIFLSAGRRDPIVGPENTLELTQMLQEAGADVSLNWHRGGHELGADEIKAAGEWLFGQV